MSHKDIYDGRVPRSPNGWDIIILGALILSIVAVASLSGCGPIHIPNDCRLASKKCPEGYTCHLPDDGRFYPWECRKDPEPTPSPSPSPSPSPVPTPPPTPTPSATPPPPPTPTPTPSLPPVPTPTPSPTPCSARQEKVCVATEGGDIIGLFNPNAQSGPTACWTAATWLEYMIRHGYFSAGDPAEDGDAPGGNAPGHWKNDDGHGRVQLIHKQTARRPDGRLAVDPPFMETRTVPCPTPTPNPGPTPTPVPLPSPSPGCPALLKVGGMLLSAVDCGPSCRKQGYLGVRVNFTATELCREGDPGCVCDPARNRCEMPRECQNPNGADIFLTLPGHFTNDICDQNSDNFFNCHHKPKANEAGVTEFKPCPKGAGPDDPRCTAKCVDVREFGTREVPCASVRTARGAAPEAGGGEDEAATMVDALLYGLLSGGFVLGGLAYWGRRKGD